MHKRKISTTIQKVNYLENRTTKYENELVNFEKSSIL